MGGLAAGLAGTAGIGTGLTLLGGQSSSNALRAGLADAAATLRGYQPINFATPGYSGATTDGTFNLTRSPEVSAALTGTSNAFRTAAAGYGNLLSQVRPGYDALTAAQLARNETARRSAIGNLRENLQRRRVLGSSFAQDALTRANLTYEQQAREIETTNFINSLNQSEKLYGEQATASASAFTNLLNQFNFESTMTTGMTNNINQITAGNAQLLAQIYTDIAGARAEIGGAGLGAGLNLLGGLIPS